MKRLHLTFSERTEKGRHPASRLRKLGRVPSIIYGKSGSFPISIDDVEFRMLMRQKGDAAVTVELTNQSKSVLTIITEIQRNTITDHFMHVDFQEISEGEKLTTSVPIHVKGEAFGVKNEKAMLEIVRHRVSVRCLPRHLIEGIEVDVTDLHAGQNIHIKDLPIFEGVEYPGDGQGVVIACVGETAESEEKTAPGTEEKSAEK
ncbi:MAG: 50S ribosomal protein L25 [Puniceicoccales bacterium]|jgi:large subunit ribosomal protein L25|nr:50S ribosomal protein L25 [Puniceicoccales bacterium]